MSDIVKPESLAGLAHRAAMDVFSMMLGMEAQIQPYRLEAESGSSSGGILGLIGFSGSWNGTASLCCTPAMACRIADALFMTPHPAVEDEVLDAVAEMTNMILGNVKTELENELGPMALSIPTVIYGRNFIKRSLIKQDWVVAPFSSDGEVLEVHLCVVPSQKTEPHRHGFQRALSLQL